MDSYYAIVDLEGKVVYYTKGYERKLTQVELSKYCVDKGLEPKDYKRLLLTFGGASDLQNYISKNLGSFTYIDCQCRMVYPEKISKKRR